MRRWVAQVLDKRSLLGNSKMDEVVRGMVTANPSDRFTINAVVKALGHESVDWVGSWCRMS